MCTCRDDQYQLCYDCSKEAEYEYALRCKGCGDIIDSGIYCLECGDDIAIEDNKAFYTALYHDPSYKTHECLSCAAIISTSYVQCSQCKAQ